MWKDSETIIDYLNFDYIIDAVVKLVLDDELSPSSIGLYGDWGSGKSSLMKMVEQHLISVDDKSILCIRFNGWLFEGYEDAKTALCGTILESIHKKEGLSSQVKGKVKKLWNKVDVQKILGKGIRYGLDYFMTGLTDFTISQITNAIKKSAENVTEEDIAKALRSLKTDNSIRKMVFYADCKVRRSSYPDRWTREFSIEMPVLKKKAWATNKALLESALNFLTGDRWHFSFRERPYYLENEANFKKSLYRFRNSREIRNTDIFCMLSGGLDSFIGAINLLVNGKQPVFCW